MRFVLPLVVSFLFAEAALACPPRLTDCDPDKFQVIVTHDGCPVCMNESDPPYKNKDGTISVSRMGFGPHIIDVGDWTYKTCSVSSASVKYVGQDPYCAELVECTVVNSAEKKSTINVEESFSCRKQDAEKCPSWQSCLMEESPYLEECGSDSPTTKVPARVKDALIGRTAEKLPSTLERWRRCGLLWAAPLGQNKWGTTLRLNNHLKAHALDEFCSC